MLVEHGAAHPVDDGDLAAYATGDGDGKDAVARDLGLGYVGRHTIAAAAWPVSPTDSPDEVRPALLGAALVRGGLTGPDR